MTHPNEDRKQDKTLIIVTLTLTLSPTRHQKIKDQQEVVRVTVRVDKARQEKRYKARQEKDKARQKAMQEKDIRHNTRQGIRQHQARQDKDVTHGIRLDIRRRQDKPIYEAKTDQAKSRQDVRQRQRHQK
jgi:hypothetical protein